MRYAITTAVLLLTVATSALADKAADGAEEAIRSIQQGNPRGAAVTVRQALNAEPANHLLRHEAATLLLLTGDVDGAANVWKGVLEERPGDALALYGQGIVALQKGDRNKALDLIQVAGQTGDRATCLIAERYLESLTGATGAGLGLSLPDAYAGSAKGLSGMAAARMGDAKRGLTEITAALAALPGEPYYETPGVAMSFDPAAPIKFGFAPLPGGNGLAVQRARTGDKPISGIVTLAPDDAVTGAGYVVFKIDGNLASMSNSRPFRLIWDTAKVANGPHKVEILVYDAQSTVVSQAEKIVRTANANAPGSANQDSERAQAVLGRLWQVLALRPSRHMLAYTGADAAQRLGDLKSAVLLMQLAAALDPDYRDTRSRLDAVFPSQAFGAFWKGDAQAPVIALTFDDGPKPGVTERLVDTLAREGVAATFFVIGRHATAYPALIKRIADAGFEIENHTYTHPNLTMLSPVAVEAELLKTAATVYASTGKSMRYFRPPGGNVNSDVYRAAAKWGLTACMWTVDADSVENGNPDRLVEFVVSHAVPGAIVLMHNGRQTTVDALPRIVTGLRQRGFRFDTIDGLLGRKTLAGPVQATGKAPDH